MGEKQTNGTDKQVPRLSTDRQPVLIALYLPSPFPTLF